MDPSGDRSPLQRRRLRSRFGRSAGSHPVHGVRTQWRRPRGAGRRQTARARAGPSDLRLGRREDGRGWGRGRRADRRRRGDRPAERGTDPALHGRDATHRDLRRSKPGGAAHSRRLARGEHAAGEATPCVGKSRGEPRGAAVLGVGALASAQASSDHRPRPLPASLRGGVVSRAGDSREVRRPSGDQPESGSPRSGASGRGAAAGPSSPADPAGQSQQGDPFEPVVPARGLLRTAGPPPGHVGHRRRREPGDRRGDQAASSLDAHRTARDQRGRRRRERHARCVDPLERCRSDGLGHGQPRCGPAGQAHGRDLPDRAAGRARRQRHADHSGSTASEHPRGRANRPGVRALLRRRRKGRRRGRELPQGLAGGCGDAGVVEAGAVDLLRPRLRAGVGRGDPRAARTRRTLNRDSIHRRTHIAPHETGRCGETRWIAFAVPQEDSGGESGGRSDVYLTSLPSTTSLTGGYECPDISPAFNRRT